MKASSIILTVLLFFLTTITTQKVHSANLNLNDVTYLLPIPKSFSEENLLRAFTVGNKGEILPEKYLNLIEVLDQHEAMSETVKKLVVLGIRLDPCFMIDNKCVPQVRLVLQPLVKRYFGNSTQDAAIHAFYNLSAQEFKNLVIEIQKIKSSYPQQSEPLQIHPILNKEGYSGSFAKLFFPTLLKYIGEKNLSRMTFMNVFVGGDKWGFGGFDIVNGQAIEMTIPRVNDTFQTFRVSTVNGKNFFRGEIKPAPQGADSFGKFVENSNNISDEQYLKEILIASRRMENPKIHSPASVDCVSCHLTQPASNIASESNKNIVNDPEVIRNTFQSKLENLSSRKRDVRVLRSLGYFEADPITNQRVVNESVQILELINQYL